MSGIVNLYMELNQLRYACAIDESGSFSRAAERCQVAQPSLSQQILKLEEELGVKLFDRLGRGVRLTESGRAFLPHARAVVAGVELARASIASDADGVFGAVCLGAIPTIAPYLVPPSTAAFTTRFASTRLRIVEEVTPVLIEGLRDSSIDFALLALPLRHKDLVLQPVRTEPLFAALAETHPLAARDSISVAELRGEPFVMLRDGHCFRDLSLSLCGSAHIKPNIAFESSQFSSVLGMVAAGIGVSIVPEMAIKQATDCRYVRLRDEGAVRRIVLASLRGRHFNRAQQELAQWFQTSPGGTKKRSAASQLKGRTAGAATRFSKR